CDMQSHRGDPGEAWPRARTAAPVRGRLPAALRTQPPGLLHFQAENTLFSPWVCGTDNAGVPTEIHLLASLHLTYKQIVLFSVPPSREDNSRLCPGIPNSSTFRKSGIPAEVGLLACCAKPRSAS